MLTYIVLCFISILTGRGILRLINITLDSNLSFSLAPILTLSFWTIFFGWTILYGYTVSSSYVVCWLITLILSFLGITTLRKEPLNFKKNWLDFCLIFILPVLLMAPYFYLGLSAYMGSNASDGWAYISYGQYLWKYPRGADTGLFSLYEYGAYLSHTRFISSAILGFFSPLTGHVGDVFISRNFFLAWTMFVYTTSCLFFASTQNLERFKIFYVLICVFSGWLLRVLIANNYDNALALAFLPAFAGIVSLTSSQDRKYTIIYALLLTATFYCYAEMSPIIAGGCALFLFAQIFKNKNLFKEWIILIFLTILLTSILIAPYFKQLLAFFLNQFDAAVLQPVGVPRPGEGMYSDVLNRSYWPVGIWGLISPPLDFNRFHLRLSHILAICLNILFVLGFINLIKIRQWGMSIFVGALSIGALVMLLHFNYSYGTYKLVLLSWWAICFTIIVGIKKLFAEQMFFKLKAAGLGFLLLAFLFVNYKISIIYYRAMPIKQMCYYQQLEYIKSIISNRPILVAVNDGFASQWAIYFLRDVPTKLLEYRLYIDTPEAIYYLQKSPEVKVGENDLLLTDNSNSLPKSFLLWSGGPYYLWKLQNNSIVNKELRTLIAKKHSVV